MNRILMYLAFIFIINVSCSGPPAKVYQLYDYNRHISSIINLFGYFVIYTSENNEVPSNPSQVMSLIGDKTFYSYFNVDYDGRDKSTTSNELHFIQPWQDLKSQQIYDDIMYLRAYCFSDSGEKLYVGFTFLYLIPIEEFKDNVGDYCNWEQITLLEGQRSIPYDLMKSDGVLDPIMIRLDYYKDIPYNRIDSIFWERS